MAVVRAPLPRENPRVPTIDMHQHLWPEPLVAALARRHDAPRLQDGMLELPGEDARVVDLAMYGLEARLALLDRLSIDVAVVSLSPLLGIDTLPAGEAAELVGAYEEGMLELTSATGGRIVGLAAAVPRDGLPGVCVAASRLGDLAALAPVLDDVERRGTFVFVHPEPASAPPGMPTWWPAVVEYTAQMQAAYAAWLAGGAERWPDVRIVFAHLAGGAPFQLERLRSWGVAGRDVLYENVFFETSSYGNRAFELCLATFGVGQLVFGSDTPILDPEAAMDSVRGFGDAVTDALCNQNPSRLLE
jgi:hypothetical protein